MLAVAITGGAWMIARQAARERGVTIGATPAAAAACAAAVAALAASRTGMSIAVAAALATVTVAALTDLRCGLMFDRLTVTLAAGALGIALAGGHIVDALIGGMLLGGVLFALYVVTNRQGLGLGDVKLAAALGAALGAPAGALAMGFAFVLGGAYGAWLLATGRARRRTAIRFGPFIAAGTYLSVLVPGLQR